MDTFAQKNVFITGGSAGIGRAAALQLARSGANVAICARGAEQLEETLSELREQAASPSQVFASYPADITDRSRMNEVAAEAIEALGAVDTLIANAGFAECLPIAEADEDHFRRLMDVNFFGQVNTVQAFLPHFVERKSGDIVLVSSMLAVFAVWGYGGYSASKFAIRGFAEALRQEMLLHDVRVKLFLPPTTDTPGLARENEDKPALSHEMEMHSSFNKTHPPDKVAAALLKWIPAKRFLGYATLDSWFQYFASRHFPNLTLKIADGEMYGAMKRLGEQGVEVG